MLDKILLPYTRFADLTRSIQVGCFSSYEARRKLRRPISAEDEQILRSIRPEILDKVAFFLTRKANRLSPSFNNNAWYEKLLRKNGFKQTDALQQVRASAVDHAYLPWSNNYVYEWSDFFDWYNRLDFTSQCSVNDAIEVISGKNLFQHVESFSANILAHAKSGQNFYPAPQYNPYTECHERPEVMMHKFSVDKRKIESAADIRRRLKMNSPFDDAFSEYGDDDYSYRKESIRHEEPFRYTEITLPQLETSRHVSATLENALRQIFALQGNKKNDHNFSLKYEGTIIATFKHVSGAVSVNSIQISHEIPAVLTKDLLLSAISKIGVEAGAVSTFRTLLDNELGL